MQQHEAYKLLERLREGEAPNDLLPTLRGAPGNLEQLTQVQLSHAMDDLVGLHRVAFAWEASLDKDSVLVLRKESSNLVKLRTALDMLDLAFLIEKGHVRTPWYRGTMPLD